MDQNPIKNENPGPGSDAWADFHPALWVHPFAPEPAYSDDILLPRVHNALHELQLWQWDPSTRPYGMPLAEALMLLPNHQRGRDTTVTLWRWFAAELPGEHSTLPHEALGQDLTRLAEAGTPGLSPILDKAFARFTHYLFLNFSPHAVIRRYPHLPPVRIHLDPIPHPAHTPERGRIQLTTSAEWRDVERIPLYAIPKFHSARRRYETALSAENASRILGLPKRRKRAPNKTPAERAQIAQDTLDATRAMLAKLHAEMRLVEAREGLAYTGQFVSESQLKAAIVEQERKLQSALANINAPPKPRAPRSSLEDVRRRAEQQADIARAEHTTAREALALASKARNEELDDCEKRGVPRRATFTLRPMYAAEAEERRTRERLTRAEERLAALNARASAPGKTRRPRATKAEMLERLRQQAEAQPRTAPQTSTPGVDLAPAYKSAPTRVLEASADIEQAHSQRAREEAMRKERERTLARLVALNSRQYKSREALAQERAERKREEERKAVADILRYRVGVADLARVAEAREAELAQHVAEEELDASRNNGTAHFLTIKATAEARRLAAKARAAHTQALARLEKREREAFGADHGLI